MANRDLSARRIIGFACNQAFAFFLLYMGLGFSGAASSAVPSAAGVVLALASMVVGFSVLRAMPDRARDAAFSRPCLYVLSVVMAAASLLLVVAVPEVPAIPAVVASSVLAGLPCAVLLAAWGRTFGAVPESSSIPEVFLGSLVAAFFCLVFSLVGQDNPAYVIMCFLPTGSVVNIEVPAENAPVPNAQSAKGKASPCTPPAPDVDDGPSLSSKILAGTLFFGFAAGVACAPAGGPGEQSALVFSVCMVVFGAFVIGALTLLLSDGFGRGASLNKSYRLALFVMMAGVLVASWPPVAASVLPGESLVLAGYLGLETVFISLFLVMAEISNEDASRAFSAGFSALFAGQALGMVACEALTPAASYAPAGVAGIAVLVAYLFLFTERDFDALSQIVARADDFESACLRIVEAHGLSKRESEILAFALRGRTSERIAEELVISKSTVDTHLRRIYAKCGVHSRQELIDLAEK